MPSFEIIHPGLMTSIQDFGRKGLAYYAIPNSGVMDQNAAKIALLLLHKKEDSPLIECTSIAPQIKFNGATRISLTGADFNWQINGRAVSLNQVLQIQKGDVLKGQSAKEKLRGYIAFSGDLILHKIYQSYSTYTNAKLGGFDGRLLKKGDEIEWIEKIGFEKVIPIKKGPEFDFLSDKAKVELTSNSYVIGADSNRMGIRLKGEKLESSSYQLENSAPVLPGFIQLPPSGLPIIILQDGQTTGGYPRIAYVPQDQLSNLNQVPIGVGIKFEFC
ncbi:5-oxoprolinase subunit C family protein [Namhaeicola litoreus]|uniref:Biotin-dependent carboxyltransferase family protein n=1 Tax=Namhaeicola litoreus TaxID=1052145 RepID=A0ABW3XXW1_9FLAO